MATIAQPEREPGPAEQTRAYLAGVSPVSTLPPSVMMREIEQLRHLLGQVLGGQDHSAAALAALEQARQAEPDFAGWLARVLAILARRLGSSGAVLAGRPGSWEAADVRHLLGRNGRPR